MQTSHTFFLYKITKKIKHLAKYYSWSFRLFRKMVHNCIVASFILKGIKIYRMTGQVCRRVLCHRRYLRAFLKRNLIIYSLTSHFHIVRCFRVQPLGEPWTMTSCMAELQELKKRAILSICSYVWRKETSTFRHQQPHVGLGLFLLHVGQEAF